jgi:predicted phosphoribosyltransferase
VDELVCPLRPRNFYAVSLWYDRFEQVSDDEVRTLLEKAAGVSGE